MLPNRGLGYDETNLNCGCTSKRVPRGAFGADLIAEPRLVADCVKGIVEEVEEQMVAYMEREAMEKGTLW